MKQQLLSFEPRQRSHATSPVSTPPQFSQEDVGEPKAPEKAAEELWGRIISVSNRMRLFGDVKKDVTVVGRSHKCDIQLGNGSEELWISSKHFVIYKDYSKRAHAGSGDDDDMDVEDTRIEDISTHGTWLNGALIGKGNTMSLTDGDQIGLRIPRRDGRAPRDHNTITFMFHKLDTMNAHKAKRCSIPDESHPMCQKYDFLNTLGEGQYSFVYEGMEKATGRHVAIKVISLRNTMNDKKFTNDADKSVSREVSIMTQMRHLCCLPILDYMEDAKDEKKYIVLELATGGDLFEFVRSKGSLSNDEAATAFCQLLCAVKYLHSAGIIHRDLKPENALLCKDPVSKQTIIKVADFGLAKILNSSTMMMKTLCGTTEYIAPEVIATANFCTMGYTGACDCWSLGVLLYFLLSGTTAFSSGDGDICQQILTGSINYPEELWCQVDPLAMDLTKKFLVVDPEERISISDAMKHPWIQYGLNKLVENGGPLGEMASHELEEQKRLESESMDIEPPEQKKFKTL